MPKKPKNSLLKIFISHRGPHLSANSVTRLKKLIQNAVEKLVMEEYFIRSLYQEIKNYEETTAVLTYNTSSKEDQMVLG